MRGRPNPFSGFVGGVNQRDSPYLLSEKPGTIEARDARNVQGTVRGAIRKRDGASQFSTPANAFTSTFATLIGGTAALIGAGSTKLFKVDAGGIVTDITGALVLANNALWDFVQAPASGGQGPVYGMNGTDAAQWTGAGNAAAWTASAGTLPAGGKYLIYAGNRVFVAGMTALAGAIDPTSAVAVCVAGNPRDFSVANGAYVVEFDPNDGEPITAIGTVGPYVLVAKPSKVWAIYDLDTGANRRITENIGCVANRSMIETDAGAFFLTRDQGVFSTGGAKAERLNDKLQPMFDSIVQNNRQLASGEMFAGHYYLAVSTTGIVNNLLLDYDMRLGSWWIHDLPAAQLTVWEPSGTPELHAAVAAIARTDRLFVPGRHVDAGGALYASYWRGPWHVFGSQQLRKRARALHFDGKGVIEVSIGTDFSRSTLDVGSADFTDPGGDFGVDDGSLFGISDGTIYGGATEVAEQRFASLGVARAFSVEFGNMSDNEFEVDSYTFMVDPRRD